ncbi:efflux RND transporter periplasmic adaptor subunit [Spirochaeta dissipatitropha]
MKKKTNGALRLVAAVLILSGGTAGAMWWFEWGLFAAASHAGNTAEQAPERVAAAEGTVTVSIERPSLVEPYLVRTLRAPSGGEIVYIAESGRYAEAGDVLVRFNSTQAERQVRTAELQRNDSRLQFEQSEAAVHQAEQLLAERERLFEREAISRDQLQAARDQLSTAVFRMESARISLERAELNLESVRDDLAALSLRAPFDGTVLSTALQVGDWAGQNTTLLSFGDVQRLRFIAEIDEYDIGRVEIGLPVQIRSDSLDGLVLRAQLESISPEAKIVNNISIFTVSAVAENNDSRLRPGMTADLVVVIARDSGIVVPGRAVSTVRTRHYVDVVQEDGEIETRRVELGASDGMNTVVLEGLEAGEILQLPESIGVLPPTVAAEPLPTQTNSTIIPLPGSSRTDGAAPAPAGGGGGGGGRQ